jgi:RsiW-degrading membrane proteinase PrsW (M82 family)
MQLKGGVSSLFEKTSLPVLLLAVFTALLWYLVLMRYGSQDVQLRWWWGLLPFAAGVLSIVPTVWMAIFQAQVLQLKEADSTVALLKYYILGVGMREEVAKMLLMLPFMPWLLRRRSAGLALMVGALVGLGFAFEENTGYIFGGEEVAAFTRLFSANFMHVAMSGLCGLALYELLRSRFGSAQQFLLWVGLVILAHGVYDWAFTGVVETAAVGSLGMISIVVLALLAEHFFRHVNAFLKPKRMSVSATSILLWGAAVLGAVGFIGAASMGLGSAGVARVGSSMLEMLPICVMHVRHLRMI